MEAGEWQLALWATTQGLMAAPASELLYQDRMRAFHAGGDAVGLEAAMRELLAAVGAKQAAVVPSRTPSPSTRSCASLRLREHRRRVRRDPTARAAGWLMSTRDLVR